MRLGRYATIAAVLGVLGGAPVASAAELVVAVRGAKNDRGRILVALCSRGRFLKESCEYAGSGPVADGRAEVVVDAVPPGTYALQAFHDENGNRQIDRNFLGLPTEGLGFGNDARMLFGPPDYDDATVTVAEPGSRATIRLRYFVD